MLLEKFQETVVGNVNYAKEFIFSNRKFSFAISSLLAIIITSIFFNFSRGGFSIIPVAVISAFCMLICYNILYAYRNYRRATIYAFLISAIFLFYLAAQFIGVQHDLNDQMNAALAVEEGRNIYTDVQPFYTKVPIHKDAVPLYKPEELTPKMLEGDYYYSPGWAYVSFATYKLSKLTGIYFSTISQLPMILCTLLIAFLLFRIMKHHKKNEKEIYVVAASYLFNPLVLMVAGYHGQVDNLGIVVLVLYIYYILREKKNNLLSPLFLGLSLIVKPVTATAMPYFVAKQKKFLRMMMFGFMVAFPYAFLLLIYPHASLISKIKTALPYGGVRYLWGYSRIENYLTTVLKLEYLHHLFNYIYPVITILFFASMFFYFLRRQDIGCVDGIILSNLFFFTFSSGFGLQYFLWMIPFLALKANENKFRQFYFLFTGWSSIMALAFYYGNANVYYFVRDAIGYSIIGVPLWIFMVLWWAWYIRIGVNAKSKKSIW